MRKPEAAAQSVSAALSCHIVSPASAPQVQPVWLPTGVAFPALVTEDQM